jgi:hypothetical protein
MIDKIMLLNSIIIGDSQRMNEMRDQGGHDMFIQNNLIDIAKDLKAFGII